MPGTLFIVATPIGNLEDISARALRTLREVALIAAEDTRRTSHLLARYAITTPTTSLHEHNETSKSRSILARLEQGDNVALVSDAGTPTISDPGQRFVRLAAEAGIRVESIPGPSAVMAALAASGFSSDTFSFLGFPPTRSKDRKEWFTRLTSTNGTIVFFEAPHRIRRTLEELKAEIGDRPILAARELTKAHEELVRGPISAVLHALAEPIGEFTVVIDIGHKTDNGQVVAPEAQDMLAEFGRLTEIGLAGRRDAIGMLAKRYGMSTNAVYELLEQAKKYVK